MSPHLKSVLQALLVTFLWSTSVILIKVGLGSVPALMFAALRYGLASLILLPLAIRALRRADAVRPARADWLRLAALGLVMYTFTQGAQFMALQYLPAATHSMILNSSVLLVTGIGIVWLSEYPTRLQIIGMLVFIAGLSVYFFPADLSGTQGIGIVIALFQVAAGAAATTLGRAMNRAMTLPTIVITTMSMGIGAVVLLISGLLTQGLPPLTVQDIAIIVWLAVVNTAFAFTLWNHTQRTLSAMESSMINSTMLIQIGVLAWLFLGEALSTQQIIGMMAASIGIALVQVRRMSRARIGAMIARAASLRP